MCFELFDPCHYGYTGQMGINICHNDHTKTNFSRVKCVDLNFNYLHCVKSGFRKAIEEQIANYKSFSIANKTYFCEKCLKTSNQEVDHSNPTFQQLFNTFCTSFDIKAECLKIVQNPVTLAPIIQDSIVREQWMDYHKKNAKLRILCKSCNCQRKKYSSTDTKK